MILIDKYCYLLISVLLVFRPIYADSSPGTPEQTTQQTTTVQTSTQTTTTQQTTTQAPTTTQVTTTTQTTTTTAQPTTQSTTTVQTTTTQAPSTTQTTTTQQTTTQTTTVQTSTQPATTQPPTTTQTTTTQQTTTQTTTVQTSTQTTTQPTTTQPPTTTQTTTTQPTTTRTTTTPQTTTQRTTTKTTTKTTTRSTTTTKATTKSNSDIPELDDNVYVLTDANFQKFVSSHDITVVFFYAPWCGHCKTMKPFFHQAAKILKEGKLVKADKQVMFAKVDATVEKQLNKQFQIPGYPTLKIIRRNAIFPYEGPRGPGIDVARYMANEASNKWRPPISKVVYLTASNFTQWTRKNDFGLVMFYKKDCPTCEQLIPHYEKAAIILSEEKKPISLARVDGERYEDLAKENKINGMPSLVVYKNGRRNEYQGGLAAQDIVKYMLKTRSSGSQEINEYAKFYHSIRRASEIYVMGVFDNEDQPLYKVYMQFAAKYSLDLDLFHTFNSKSFVSYFRTDKAKSPLVGVYYHQDLVILNHPKYAAFNNENGNLEDLENFIFKTSLATLPFVSPITEKLIFSKIRPICYLFFSEDVEIKPHLYNIRDQTIPATKAYKNTRFVIVNKTENLELARRFTIEDSKSETVLVCLDTKSRLYILNDILDGFMYDYISGFLKDFHAGRLNPFTRSEELPKEQGVVKEVVGKSFNNFIDKPNTDIVIFLYRKGKDTANEAYLNLAAMKYTLNKEIVFGKINILKNDVNENFELNFNTDSLYFVPWFDKTKPVMYRGKIEPEELNKFVERNFRVSNDRRKKVKKAEKAKSEQTTTAKPHKKDSSAKTEL